jgi:hypothetical protein
MKEIDGPTLKCVMDAVSQRTDNEAEEDDNCNISRPRVITLETKASVSFPSEKERKDFDTFRKQFLQGLVDNIRERFPDELLKTVTVLDCTTWPTDDVSRALFGDAEVVELGKTLRMEVCNDYKYIEN